MGSQIDELLQAAKALEAEMERDFRKRREEFLASVEEKRLRVAEEMLAQHRRLRAGVLGYLISSRPLVALTAPLIYAGLLPMVMLDLFMMLYQAVCFPIYGIPKVRRRDYWVFDREELPYLNVLEKMHCGYCSYANGLSAFFREVTGRTEQYWCPIKHARRIRDAHGRYPHFFEYGDVEAYHKGLERIRKEYARVDKKQARPPA
ncbi:MAG TPA: hypothetical protein VIU29_09520 [Candidatus Deferrimicrobiaceae bacterium]